VNRERKRDEKKQMENKTTSHPAVPKTQHPFAPSPPVSTLLPCLPFSDFPLQTQIPRRGRNENFQSDERMGKKWAQTNRKDRRDKKKINTGCGKNAQFEPRAAKARFTLYTPSLCTPLLYCRRQPTLLNQTDFPPSVLLEALEMGNNRVTRGDPGK